MKSRFIVHVLIYLSVLSAASLAIGNEPDEPAWLPPLASGSAPACPEHTGVRDFQSEIAQFQDITATIVGSSRRGSSACSAEADLLLIRAGRQTRIKLQGVTDRDFSIIDFSPDKKYLLISSEVNDPVTASGELESQDLSLIQLSSGNLAKWSIWKAFGWKDCDATVEVQGFLPNNQPVIRARPSIWNGHPHPNCVTQSELYSFNPADASIVKLAKATKVARYGEQMQGAKQSCKSDPDLVAQCFTVHGRLDFYNGGPSTRIWVVGTHHMLGVDDEIVPDDAASKLDWNTDVYGDFKVCPFAREEKGHMQSVCIEGTKNLRTSPRK